MTQQTLFITGDSLVAEVKRLAAENPDFVYDKKVCVYWDDDEECGSCLLGQALFNLGVPAYVLKVCDSYPDTGLSVQRVLSGFVVATDEQWNWLAKVQYRQDARAAWGIAVEVS